MKEFNVTTYDLLLQEQMSPVELMWLYLDGDTTPTHRYVYDTQRRAFGGYSHQTLSWQRGNVSSSSKGSADKVNIRIDNVDKWFATLMTQRPVDGARLRLLRVFRETWEDSSAYIVIFDGRIQSMSFETNIAVVEVVSHLDFLNKRCPARLYMPQCNYRFGSTRCGVDVSSYETNPIVGEAASTTTSFVNSSLVEADNYWAFGYVEITDGTYKGLTRGITSSSKANTAVYLKYPFPVSLVGVTAKVVPGCQKTKPFCAQRYQNLDNYGGFAEVPRRPLIPVPR